MCFWIHQIKLSKIFVLNSYNFIIYVLIDYINTFIYIYIYIETLYIIDTHIDLMSVISEKKGQNL